MYGTRESVAKELKKYADSILANGEIDEKIAVILAVVTKEDYRPYVESTDLDEADILIEKALELNGDMDPMTDDSFSSYLCQAEE